MSEFERLLDPSKIAIAGLSADPAKHGARVLAALRKLGFQGEIWGVNPGLPEIDAVDVFASVDDLPTPPDLVVAAVPGAAARDLIAGCRGVGWVILFAAGFAESGEEGRDRQEELVDTARSVGTRLVGPNSGGVIRPGTGLAASFLTCLDRPAAEIRSGPVGLVTQSGGTGSYLHNLAAARGEGIAVSISTGNEGDFELGEAIEAVSLLDDVKVILTVIETVRDGRRFIDAVRSAESRGKQLVACRIGTGQVGRRLMGSHTGAMAVAEKVMSGVFESLDVIATETPGEAYEVAVMLAHSEPARGGRVGIVTHSGGVAILLADLAGGAGLTLDPPGEILGEAVRAHLDHGSVGNPLDMGGIIGDPGRFASVVGEFSRSGDYDVVLAVSTAHPPSHTVTRARSLIELEQEAPVLHLWMAGDQASQGLAKLRKAGMAITEEPRAAIRALVGLTRRRDAHAPPAPIFGPPEHWGVPPLEGAVASNIAEGIVAADSLGYPVVVKLDGNAPAHKTDVAGVILDVRNRTELEEAFRSLLQLSQTSGLRSTSLRLQRFRPGLEVIVGAVRHDVFGPLVSVGLGGVLAEVLDDVVFSPAPITPLTALALIDRLDGRVLLDGYRGANAADVTELARIVSQVSRGIAGLAVEEFEMNPLIWDGTEWLAVDVYAS
jgi:acyl-CoA synthetase (NDP forming)